MSILIIILLYFSADALLISCRQNRRRLQLQRRRPGPVPGPRPGLQEKQRKLELARDIYSIENDSLKAQLQSLQEQYTLYESILNESRLTEKQRLQYEKQRLSIEQKIIVLDNKRRATLCKMNASRP